MRYFRNELRRLEKLANTKFTNDVMILQMRDGKFYFRDTEIDLSSASAKVLIIDDIPAPPKEGEY